VCVENPIVPRPGRSDATFWSLAHLISGDKVKNHYDEQDGRDAENGRAEGEKD
jgi:hypothetical protein